MHFLAEFFEEGACKYLKFCLWYKTTVSFSYCGFTSLRTRWVWADTNQANPLGIRRRSLKAGAQPQGTAANKRDPGIWRENELGVILQCVSKRCVRKGRFFLSPLILIFGGNYLIVCQPVLHPGQFFLSPKFFQVTWFVCALMKSWNFRRKATLLTNKNTIPEKKKKKSWKRKPPPGLYWKFPNKHNGPGKRDHTFISWISIAIHTVINKFSVAMSFPQLKCM